MVARFQSVCPACGGRIEIGAPIVAGPEKQGASVWVHEVCPPAKFDIVRDICPGCFTERSVTGACMCPEVA